MKPLRKHQLFKLASMSASLFDSDYRSIFDYRLPANYFQLQQFWPCIKEWEFCKERTIARLLELIRLRRVDNPRFRNSDTAALWASRIYDYRRLVDWTILDINRRGLGIRIHGHPATANFHYKYHAEGKYGYAYFKHSKHWTDLEYTTALSVIRLFHERENLYGNLEQPVEYRYICLLEDKEHILTDSEYNDWSTFIKPRIERLVRSYHA